MTFIDFHLELPKDFKFVVDGLDENGNLAVPKGADKELKIKLVGKLNSRFSHLKIGRF